MFFISKSVTDRQFLLNKSFTYFWMIYYIVKLRNCSCLYFTVIATKMTKCLLSLKVLQSNIKVPLAYCHFYMFLHLTIKIYIPLSLVHLVYMAGDNCMCQNYCLKRVGTYVSTNFKNTFYINIYNFLHIYQLSNLTQSYSMLSSLKGVFYTFPPICMVAHRYFNLSWRSFVLFFSLFFLVVVHMILG